MKQKFYNALKSIGLIVLVFICGFSFFDLFILIGLNEGVATLKVAGLFIITFVSIIAVYKRSAGFSF